MLHYVQHEKVVVLLEARSYSEILGGGFPVSCLGLQKLVKSYYSKY